MKNLTIKSFISFFITSFIVIVALFMLLYIFIPYSGQERNREYIKTESEALAARCLNHEKAEAERDIYHFASSTGAFVELKEYEGELPPQEDTLIYPLKFSDSDKEL